MSEVCACVVCVFLSSFVLLGAVFSVHPAFLTAEIMFKKMNFVMLKLFFNMSVALEHIPVFKQAL